MTASAWRRGAVALGLVLAGSACSRGGGPALPVPVPLRHAQRGSLEPCAPALEVARAELRRMPSGSSGRPPELRTVRRTTYAGAVRLLHEAGATTMRSRSVPRTTRPLPPPPFPAYPGRTEVCLFSFRLGSRSPALALVVSARHPRLLVGTFTERLVRR